MPGVTLARLASSKEILRITRLALVLSPLAFLPKPVLEVPLDSKAGLELMASLCQVFFSRHPEQINAMDKTNGKTIASLQERQ
jgi:hypothetical protein